MLIFCPHISYFCFVLFQFFAHQLGDIDLIVDRRTNEVSKFLEMLRSASETDKAVIQKHETTSKDWKVVFSYYKLVMDLCHLIHTIIEDPSFNMI